MLAPCAARITARMSWKSLEGATGRLLCGSPPPRPRGGALALASARWAPAHPSALARPPGAPLPCCSAVEEFRRRSRVHAAMEQPAACSGALAVLGGIGAG